MGDMTQQEYNLDLWQARNQLRELRKKEAAIHRAMAVYHEDITELKRRAYALGLNPYGDMG
jgi:hypothetical protein